MIICSVLISLMTKLSVRLFIYLIPNNEHIVNLCFDLKQNRYSLPLHNQCLMAHRFPALWYGEVVSPVLCTVLHFTVLHCTVLYCTVLTVFLPSGMERLYLLATCSRVRAAAPSTISTRVCHPSIERPVVCVWI